MQSQKDNLIAKKYAEALAQLREGQTVIDDLNLVKDCFNNSKELTSFLANPQYTHNAKAQVINKIFL